jgi:hypothetical protein
VILFANGLFLTERNSYVVSKIFVPFTVDLYISQHTSGHEFDTTPSLSNNVTISKAEYGHLLQAVREYSTLFLHSVDTHTCKHSSNAP